MKSPTVLIDRHPGRSAQTIGIARELGTDPDLIHEPSVGVVGTKGDSQCYMGVVAKVDAIHASLKSRIGKGAGPAEAAPGPAGIHDRDVGRHPQRHARNALLADRARSDERCAVRASERHGLAGTIAVVACDKPPVGTLAALLEHNQPAIIMSDGAIHPGTDPETGEKLDIVSAYQVAGHPDAAHRHHIACHACPGYRQLRRHVHLQHHADLHRRRRHAAAAHGGAAVRRSAPRSRSFRTELVELPRANDREGPEAARHRRARFDPQRRHRRDGDRRLDQRHAACAGDRARRGLRATSGRTS